MSKRTVVSDYIENNLKNIKKDSFLEELSILDVSYSKQCEIILEEISALYQYIKMIKENKHCYEIRNNRRVLTQPIKNYISNLRKIINKYYEYARYLKLLEKYQTRRNLIEKQIEFESNEINITEQQLNLLKTIDNDNIKDISFDDLGAIAKYLIYNYEAFNNKLDLILRELGSRYKYNEYDDERYIILSSVKGFINNKINNLDKEDYRRIKLREYKKYIKSIIEMIRQKEEKKHDYRYDIVEILMEDEYCFNRLLEEMPDIVNLCDKDGYSLSYNVLQKYLDYYLLELQGKEKGKVKNKLLNTYHKIIFHPFYSNTIENKLLIDDMINNFQELIKNGKFRRDKYLEVLTNFVDIQKPLIEETFIPKINRADIIDESNALLNKILYNNGINLCDEDTIILCSKKEKHFNYAYSVSKNNQGNHILKVHITNIREFIKHDSMLDLYLKENVSKGYNNWMDEALLNKFSLNLEEVKPVYTFEMVVLPSGKINNFKCYKSNIRVNDIYTYEEANEEIKKHNLRFLPYLEINYFLNKNINKENYALSMVNGFNKPVFDTIGNYFEKNKLPYIYKSQKGQDSARYIKNMTTLNVLFSKIPKDYYKKFYQIICDDINYSKYTSKPENHESLNQKYYSDLFIPLYSYVGIFIQEMIEQFYLNQSIGEILDIKKDIWNQERDYILKHANSLKSSKRDVEHKNKIKMLRKQ